MSSYGVTRLDEGWRSSLFGWLAVVRGWGTRSLAESLPHDEAGQAKVAKQLGVPVEKVKRRVVQLHEANPMLGLRGCRLAIRYPEIGDMQVRAIIDAAIEVKKRGHEVLPEIMIPLIGTVEELAFLKKRAVAVALNLGVTGSAVPAGACGAKGSTGPGQTVIGTCAARITRTVSSIVGAALQITTTVSGATVRRRWSSASAPSSSPPSAGSSSTRSNGVVTTRSSAAGVVATSSTSMFASAGCTRSPAVGSASTTRTCRRSTSTSLDGVQRVGQICWSHWC